MSQGSLSPGITGQAQDTVAEKDLAPHVGSGDAEVYATPRLAALMERAAVNCLEGLLPEGRTTVGTRLELSHMAPTPAGLSVRATARLDEVGSKKLLFHIEAFDEGEKIGEASQERILVDRESFASRAEQKRRS